MPRIRRADPLVPIFETVDSAHVAVIKSVLEAAGIPYLTRGEDAFDAFRGAFRGTVFNPTGRPVVFLVHGSDVHDARLLVEERRI